MAWSYKSELVFAQALKKQHGQNLKGAEEKEET